MKLMIARSSFLKWYWVTTVLVLFVLPAGHAASWSKAETAAVEGMIQKYGKSAIIRVILEKRNGRITLDVGGKAKNSSGPPNEKFVTPRSILFDLDVIGASAADLQEFLQKRLTASADSSTDFVVSNQNLAATAARGHVSISGADTSSSISKEEGRRSSASENESAKVKAWRAEIAMLEEDIAKWKVMDSSSSEIPRLRQHIRTLEIRIESEKNRVKTKDKMSRMDPAASPGDPEEPQSSVSAEEQKKQVWIARYDQQVAKIKRLKEQLTSAENEFREAEKLYNLWVGKLDGEGPSVESRTIPYEAQKFASQMRQADGKRQAIRAELNRAETRLTQLKEEARRDGALPGWFRGR